MLNETAVALRTKAVKALTSIVSVDPNILERVSESAQSFSVQNPLQAAGILPLLLRSICYADMECCYQPNQFQMVWDFFMEVDDKSTMGEEGNGKLPFKIGSVSCFRFLISSHLNMVRSVQICRNSLLFCNTLINFIFRNEPWERPC